MRRRCEIGESDNTDSEDYTLLDPKLESAGTSLNGLLRSPDDGSI